MSENYILHSFLVNRLHWVKLMSENYYTSLVPSLSAHQNEARKGWVRGYEYE